MADNTTVGSVDLGGVVSSITDAIDQITTSLRTFQQNFSKINIDISANPQALGSITELTNLIGQLFTGISAGSTKAISDINAIGNAAAEASAKAAGVAAVGAPSVPSGAFDAGAFLNTLEASSNQFITRFQTLEQLITGIEAKFPEMANLARTALASISTGAASGEERLTGLNAALSALGNQSGSIATKMTELRATIEGLSRERITALDAKDEKTAAELTKTISALAAEFKELSIAKEAAARITGFGKEGLVDVKSGAADEIAQRKILATEIKTGIEQEEAAREQAAQRRSAAEEVEIARLQSGQRQRLSDQQREIAAQRAADEEREAQARRVGDAQLERDRELQQQREFAAAQPLRIDAALTSQIEAQTQLAQAERATTLATRELNAARQSGDPQRIIAATQALTAAEVAQALSARSLLQARIALALTRNANTTQDEIRNAQLLSKSYSDQARAATQAANASRQAANALNETTRSGLGAHSSLLAIIGISRFLPGELGRVVSGLGLLTGAFQTTTSTAITVVGAFAAVLFALGKAGADFNDQLNKLRAQSEGLGLTIDQIKTFQLILSQTGGSIENFAVGIRKINQAIVGIGPESEATKSLLNTIFSGTGFQINRNTQPIEVILQLAKNIKQLEASGLAGAVAGELFGRSWDEVKGRLQDVDDQFLKFNRQVKDSGIFTKEAQDRAKEFGVAVEELGLAWDKLRARLAIPATGLIKIVTQFLSEGVPGFAPFGSPHPELEGLTNLQVKKIEETLNKEFTKAQRDTDAFIKRQQELRDAARKDTQEANARLRAGSGIGGADQLGTSLLNEIESPTSSRTVQTPEEAVSFSDRQLEQQKQKALEDDLKARKAQTKDQKELNAINEELVALLQDQQATLNKELAAKQKTRGFAESTLQARTRDLETARNNKKSDTELRELNKLRAVSESDFNKAQQDIINVRVKSNQLADQIKALKKDDDKPFAVLQEKQGRLREELRELEAGSEQFRTALEKLKSVDRQLIALAKTPDDRGKFQKDLSKDTRFGTKQTFDAEQIAFKEDLNAIEQEAKRAIQNIQLEQQRTAIKTKEAFAAGTISAIDAAKTEAQALIDVLNVFRQQTTDQISLIDDEINRIKEGKTQGTIVPSDANKAILELERKRADLATKNIEEINKTSLERLKLEEREKDRIIETKQELLDIEIDHQKRVNARRLELIERAAKDSVIIQERAIKQAADNDVNILNEELGRLATKFNDRKNLIVSLLTAPSGTNKNNEIITGISTKGAQDFIKGASLEQLDVIQKVIEEAQSKNISGSRELLDLYKQIRAIFDELANVAQRKFLALQDNQIDKAKILLGIEQQRLNLAELILNIEVTRLRTLTDAGLILKPEAREREISIEKEKLSLIQQRIKEVQKERDLEVARQSGNIANQNIFGSGPSNAQVAIIQTSPEVSGLNQELVKLQGEALASQDRLDLTASALGRLRTGLQDVIAILESSSDEFGIGKAVAGILRGAQELINAILGNRAQARTPAQDLKDASAKLNDDVKTAAQEFKNIINEAAKEFKKLVSTKDSDQTAQAVQAGAATGSKSGTKEGSKEGTQGLKEQILEGLSKALTVVAGITQGLTAPTTGGKIAGFGSALSIIPVAGPFIAAGAQIVGGIVDLFGALNAARAKKIGDGVEAEFKLIMSKFKSGALTLGDTLNQLQVTLERSRQALNSLGSAGKAQLAQIEIEFADAINQLKEQARQLQDKFSNQLALLRLPEEQRGPTTTFQDAFEQIKLFIGSFQKASDAVSHFADAQEFLNLTFEGLKKTAQDSLDQANQRIKDLQKQGIDNLRAFEDQKNAIINRGRVVTQFDDAKAKLAELFALESKRLNDQKKAIDDINKAKEDVKKAQNLLDFLNQIFVTFNEKLTSFLNKFVITAGISDQFSKALQKLLDVQADKRIPLVDQQLFDSIRNKILGGADIQSVIDELRNITGRVGIDQDTKNFAAEVIALLQQALGGQTGAIGVGGAAKDASDSVSALGDSSEKTSTSFANLISNVDSFAESLRNFDGLGIGSNSLTNGILSSTGGTQNININIGGTLSVDVSGASSQTVNRITQDISNALRGTNALSGLLSRGRPILP